MRSACSPRVRPPGRPRAKRRRRDAGFTLVEVVVALAILALSLSIVFPAMSNGTWRVAQADAAVKAGALAQSVLARAGVDLPLLEGRADGEFPGGFGWSLWIKRAGDAADRAQWPVGAYMLTAEVYWDEASTRRSIAVSTIRLGPKESNR
jgi:general secretion pathway protein I